MATKDHCVLWIPESSAPYRRLRKPRTYSIAVPEAPTGINFIGPTDNAEVHILWRATPRCTSCGALCASTSSSSGPSRPSSPTSGAPPTAPA